MRVLGAQGVRAFTHRAVDAEAGAPAGTTSNYFRTRDALIDGVVERFALVERLAWEDIAQQLRPGSPGELATAIAAYAQDATGPHRVLTLARYAIFMEAALQPRLQQTLAATAAHVRVWMGTWVAGVGVPDPDYAVGVLMNHMDGMMLHQLAFPDPDFDPGPMLKRVIDGLLR